jgi:glycosyltransferase involved in cell wall biosynthesis
MKDKMPRISLVIPAFNEERYLPLLLDSIASARQRYERVPDEVQIIVADNASTDGTADLARARGCCVVQVEKRAIAAARNAGARVATGEILAFVDADSQIHPDTFNAIERTLASDRVIVGATSVRYSRMSPGIAFTTFVAITLFQLTGLDAGVVFCRRADWLAVGGYNEDRLWLEDAEFLVGLKRLGRARGQRFMRAKGARAITSARKYDCLGDWHVFTHLLPRVFASLLFSRFAFGRSVRSYWYEDRR